jgi:hypothetical protein
VSGFSSADVEHLGVPVDVIQRQRGDFTRAEAVDDEQKEMA